ncbi:hypothetical protein GH714_013974 [Hevea brasiliensis]|uniref:Uncharacterized protein n=1 Tax=Hevea brasiliensis TaxID=3981 RepID=A0A6A6LJ13_HEVBR|nr:hypothetical protein GH714_013974 [Hevea brasiliensis]
MEHSLKYSAKGYDENYESSTPEENEISHELSMDKHYTETKTMGSMAKSLLPLLDAADNETEEGFTFQENLAPEIVEMENYSVSKFELENKKLALEEEVDHVYERLQALEADREFLKHCMSSIKKGDKGMDLLQEILQHLRDLRAVELRWGTWLGPQLKWRKFEELFLQKSRKTLDGMGNSWAVLFELVDKIQAIILKSAQVLNDLFWVYYKKRVKPKAQILQHLLQGAFFQAKDRGVLSTWFECAGLITCN